MKKMHNFYADGLQVSNGQDLTAALVVGLDALINLARSTYALNIYIVTFLGSIDVSERGTLSLSTSK